MTPALPLTASQFETSDSAADRTSAPATGDFTFAAEAIADLELSLVTDLSGFEALEADWNELFERSGRSTQLFQTYNWLWNWCVHFLPKKADAHTSLAVVTGRRDGRLVVLLPLLCVRGWGMTRLTLMGDPVNQYGDALVEAHAETQFDLKKALAFAITATAADAVYLRKVRDDAAIAPLLAQLGATITQTQQAPYLSFGTTRDFAEWEQSYSKSARRNRRRQLRRLMDHGETKFRQLAPGHGASAAVSTALTLKRQWLQQRGLVSTGISDKRTEAFFRACAEGGRRAPDLRVALIETENEAAAIEIAIACKDRLAIHVIAYNSRFEKAAAGALLMEDSIRRACEGGIGTFDLLAPGDSYKFDWTNTSMAVNDWVLPCSPKARMMARLGFNSLRPAAKRLIGRLPSSVRRIAAHWFAVMMVVAS